MKFYVYILYSISRDAFHIGCTGEDLLKTIQAHNSRHEGPQGHPGEWMLMHFEAYNRKEDAILRENQIKKRKSRRFIERLITSMDAPRSA